MSFPTCVSSRARAISSASGPRIFSVTFAMAPSKPMPASTLTTSRSITSGSARRIRVSRRRIACSSRVSGSVSPITAANQQQEASAVRADNGSTEAQRQRITRRQSRTLRTRSPANSPTPKCAGSPGSVPENHCSRADAPAGVSRSPPAASRLRAGCQNRSCQPPSNCSSASDRSVSRLGCASASSRSRKRVAAPRRAAVQSQARERPGEESERKRKARNLPRISAPPEREVILTKVPRNPTLPAREG